MSRSPSSSPRCGSASASSALAIAALAYLASYGARTPLLALRGLLRVRNLALIVVPAVAVGAVAIGLAVARPDSALAQGALVVAMSPAPLPAPEVVGRVRGRADLAGALVLGTVLLSLLVAGSRGALASGSGVIAVEAYALAAMFANAVPPVRDLVLTPIRWAGWIAAAAVLVSGALMTGLDVSAFPVAVALLLAGALAAAVVAAVTGRDVTAAVGGAGVRDPVLAVALAGTANTAALAVPVAYAVCSLAVAGAVAAIRR